MTIIEGYGGTGKGIVNLLIYLGECATALALPSPLEGHEIRVIDQDAAASAAPIARVVDIKGANAQFSSLLPGDDISRLHASVHFTRDELATNLSDGFHAHPKLAAAARQSHGAEEPIRANANLYILIYSSFGGTGAGLGPARMRQVLEKKCATLVYALGKYLSLPAGSTGAAGREDLEVLDLGSTATAPMLRRYFLALPQSPADGAIPADGLNHSPALLYTASYVWQVLVRQRLNESLADVFASRNQSEVVPPVDTIQRYPEWLRELPAIGMTLEDGTQLKPRTGDDRGRIALLLRYLPVWLRMLALGVKVPPAVFGGVQSLSRLGEVQKRWPKMQELLRQNAPQGDGSSAKRDWSAWFYSGFTEMADPNAAASWFHRGAVDDPNGVCRESFHKLVELLLANKLVVSKATGGVYVLSTKSRLPAEKIEDFVGRAVVGAMSNRLPPWTLSDYLSKLRAHHASAKGTGLAWADQVKLIVKSDSETGRIYGAVSSGDHGLFTHILKKSAPFPWEDRIAPGDETRIRHDWALFPAGSLASCGEAFHALCAADPNGLARQAFCRLMGLFLLGRLVLVERAGRTILATASPSTTETDDDFTKSKVVGELSAQLPPWTTYEQLELLDAHHRACGEPPWKPRELLFLKDQTSVARVYAAVSPADPLANQVVVARELPAGAARAWTVGFVRGGTAESHRDVANWFHVQVVSDPFGPHRVAFDRLIRLHLAGLVEVKRTDGGDHYVLESNPRTSPGDRPRLLGFMRDDQPPWAVEDMFDEIEACFKLAGDAPWLTGTRLTFARSAHAGPFAQMTSGDDYLAQRVQFLSPRADGAGLEAWYGSAPTWMLQASTSWKISAPAGWEDVPEGTAPQIVREAFDLTRAGVRGISDVCGVRCGPHPVICPSDGIYVQRTDGRWFGDRSPSPGASCVIGESLGASVIAFRHRTTASREPEYDSAKAKQLVLVHRHVAFQIETGVAP